MINQNAQINNTWSVLRRPDAFGYGYQAQDSQFDAEAEREGWEVLFAGMHPQTAIKFRDIYRTAGVLQTDTPSFDDLLVYDMTQPQEDRVGDFQEFDLIYTPLDSKRGTWIEAVITDFDEDTVELDGYLLVARELVEQHAVLIAKAEADCGFITEYNAYLSDLEENWNTLYAIANEAQNSITGGAAA